MAGKSISVKVSRVKIIDALQTKLDNLIKLDEEYQQGIKQHDEDIKTWESQIAELALKSSKSVQKSTRVNHNYYDEYSQNREVEITFSLPKSDIPERPERPENPIEYVSDGRHSLGSKEQIRSIENAIRILKLSDEEIVNTSTYNSVSRFL